MSTVPDRFASRTSWTDHELNLQRALKKIREADPTSSAASGQIDIWWKNVTDLIDAALAGRFISP